MRLLDIYVIALYFVISTTFTIMLAEIISEYLTTLQNVGRSLIQDAIGGETE
jgi:hypothetical protein